MTDIELESACKPGFTGAAPWAHWTSELYSIGKCFRFVAHYPSFLPLFVYSDHFVSLQSNLDPHELNNYSKVHFTWHPVKEKRYRHLKDRQVIRVPHPWIFYRRTRRKTRCEKTEGTIVFLPHHVPGYKLVNHDLESYFVELRNLSDKFQPVVLCLHMHDIDAGQHTKLRRHGFPIVTAGNTSDTGFVDRFYDVLKEYRYATSPEWGSQVAYCVEFGISYFFLGERPEYVNVSDENHPLGTLPPHEDGFHEEYMKKADALFRLPEDAVTSEQFAFVASCLGMDSQVSRMHLSWILWREFFRNWRKWWPVFLSPVATAVRKHGLLELLKKLRSRLHSVRVR